MPYKDSLIPEPLDEGKKRRKKEILQTQISSVDFESINDVGDLIESFQSSSIQARNLGQCAQIFGKMLQDEERPTIMLGLAGPLIAAGLRKVIRDMVYHNMVDIIVSTGAVLYQDYYNALGGGHYYGSPNADDNKLRELFINRIYDTYVDEELFCEDDTLIGKFADRLEPRNYSSREFIYLLSETIDDEQSILATARKKNIPIFCPALNDSSIGIGLTELHSALMENHCFEREWASLTIIFLCLVLGLLGTVHDVFYHKSVALAFFRQPRDVFGCFS